jgi:hypothetical protein
VTGKTKEKLGEAGAEALANPVAIWGVAILGVGLAASFVLPYLFSKFQLGFNAGIDSLFADLSSIVGHNPDQNPNDRSATDEVTGLLAANQGDRALSDLVDSPVAYVEGLFGFGGTGGNK